MTNHPAHTPINFLRLIFLTLLLIFSNLINSAIASQSASEQLPPCHIDRVNDQMPDAFPCSVIIGTTTGLDVATIEYISTSMGLRLHYSFSRFGAISGHVTSRQILNKLTSDASLLVIPNRMISKFARPPGAGGGGGGKNNQQVISAGVKRIGADLDLPTRGENIGIAIVDTGIDLSHPDLAVATECFDFFGDDCSDKDGHGTHVAGIATALDNNIDIVGVAPKAIPYSVRVLDARGSGSDEGLFRGLEWILNYGNSFSPPIRVVNMSLGREGSVNDNPMLHTAIIDLYNAGIVVVVAAGNDPYLEVKNNIPAAYPEVIAVASTTAEDGTSACRSHSAPILKDTASYFTTDGKYFPGSNENGVSISAPGETRENINRGCFIKSEGILSLAMGGGTIRMSGTSMATPHVAGAVALTLSENTEYKTDKIRSVLRGTASGKDSAPYASPTTSYTYDDEKEGVVSVCGIFFGQANCQ
ncbi:MAG: S8 family serine peptidase [Gammaproteobacteria bacterium]|nr:S8 family serine peptidase [Gammaproteobacteria bacterium]